LFTLFVFFEFVVGTFNPTLLFLLTFFDDSSELLDSKFFRATLLLFEVVAAAS